MREERGRIGAKGEGEERGRKRKSSSSPFAPSPRAFSSTTRPMLLSRKQHSWEDTELPAEEARSFAAFWCHSQSSSTSSSSRLSPQEGRVGSGRHRCPLHCLLSPTLLRSTTLSSSRTQSIHRFLGSLLFLVPVSLRSADHLTNSSSSFLFTCPYYLSLLSLIFSLNSATFTSCFFTCSSFTAQISAPYRCHF